MKLKYSFLKIAVKDVRLLYNISAPTYRRWIRRAGLQHLIGRRKLVVQEVLQIFIALGKPRLARTAAKRLQDIYALVAGRPPVEQQYCQKFQQQMPKRHQDLLPKAAEEYDAQPIYPLKKIPQKDQRRIFDSFYRLGAIALELWKRKLLQKEEEQPRAVSDSMTTDSGMVLVGQRSLHSSIEETLRLIATRI